jgi:hypothetical protein
VSSNETATNSNPGKAPAPTRRKGGSTSTSTTNPSLGGTSSVSSAIPRGTAAPTCHPERSEGSPPATHPNPSNATTPTRHCEEGAPRPTRQSRPATSTASFAIQPRTPSPLIDHIAKARDRMRKATKEIEDHYAKHANDETLDYPEFITRLMAGEDPPLPKLPKGNGT